MMRQPIPVILALGSSLACSSPVLADVTITFDFQAWASAAGSHTTIDFTGFPAFTNITTQYQSLGATFTDQPPIHDFILTGLATFPLDGSGLHGGSNDQINISFAAPQYFLGVHLVGENQYQLFNAGQLIYSSPLFGGPGFVGLISTDPFDAVMILDPLGPVVVVDNIYFAPGIPAPGALALLVAAALGARRRRSGS